MSAEQLEQEIVGTRGTVAVLTYRRPEDLAVVLPMLFDQIEASGDDFDVLVVDNDPAASAAPVIADMARPGLRSVVESTPGIAAARNRALAECVERDVLIFIDDDESPCENWLPIMLTEWRRSGAAAVSGAVVSEFTGVPNAWVVAGGFFVRRRRPTGTSIDVAATNNLLLDLTQLRRMNLTFDERFGISGGSDTLFTRAIVALGGSMVWCDEAVVIDRVPVDRMTPGWVLRRWLRSGNSWSRTSLVLAPSALGRFRVRLTLVGMGMARLVGGGARFMLGALVRSVRHQARGAKTAARGAGLVLGAFGYIYSEYRRKAPADPIAHVSR